MSNLSWIFEEDIFDDANQRIVDELNSLGIENQTVRYTMGGFCGFKPRFNYTQPCVYRGSIQGSRALAREFPEIYPGPICAWDKYDCNIYYPRFKNHLLNKPCYFIPFGMLLEQAELIYQTFSEDRTIFIRPNSGFKSFTGKITYKEDFAKDVSMLGYGDIPPDSMVLVSAPQNIIREERLVMYKGQYVSGSMYRHFGKLETSPDISQQSIDYANYVAKDIGWEPEKLWLMDLAYTKTDVKVLEIGAFSIAGLYNADVKPIVQAVNDYTIELYNDAKT